MSPTTEGPQPHRRAEFEALLFEHLPALHAFACRLCGERSDAHDLVQETCLRAYRFFGQFKAGTNARAWLFRIAKNTFINEYRRRSTQQASSVEFDELEERYDVEASALLRHVQDPESELERTLLAEDVAAGLALLPVEYRMVVVLCLTQGFTYQETADALEVPVGTVMSRLHRGRKLLQGHLLKHARARGFSAVPRTEESAAPAAERDPGKP